MGAVPDGLMTILSCYACEKTQNETLKFVGLLHIVDNLDENEMFDVKEEFLLKIFHYKLLMDGFISLKINFSLITSVSLIKNNF